LAWGGTHDAFAVSFHLTAASPWLSYADPLTASTGVPLLPAVYDTLTEIAADGSVAPALAESWSVESDTVWIFSLRPDVKFSNGQPLDAAAVVACLRMLIDPAGKSYDTALYVNGIVDVRERDGNKIEIRTKNRDARIARKLANVFIFSASELQRLGRAAFAKAPVGTGSFRPEHWSSGGNRVVLRSVESSWRPSQQIDRIEILVVPDASARLQSLLSGQTDFANAIDPDSIAVIEAAGHKVSVVPGTMVLSLALRTQGDAALPLRDPRVRVALNMAVNRSAISQKLLLGTMPPATQIATPGVVGYDPDLEPYPFDPDRARRLLAEAGYRDGFRMVAGLMSGQVPGDVLIYQRLAQDLAAVGVNLELRNYSANEMLRRRTSGLWDGIDAFQSLWSHYRLGDVSRAAEQFSCIDPYSSFCDPDMVELIERSNQEMDQHRREVLLKQITGRFQELAPTILLFQFAGVDGLSKRVKVIPQSTGRINFVRTVLHAAE